MSWLHRFSILYSLYVAQISINIWRLSGDVNPGMKVDANLMYCSFENDLCFPQLNNWPKSRKIVCFVLFGTQILIGVVYLY